MPEESQHQKEERAKKELEEHQKNEAKLNAIVRSELTFDANSLNKEIKENLTRDEQRALAIIGREIQQNGMTTDEARQLANVPKDVYDNLYETKPTFRKVINFKKLQYKRTVKKTLNSAIRNGDENKALKIAERLFPEEYAKNKDKKDNHNLTLLREAILFVRENSDTKPLVSDNDDRTHTKASGEKKPQKDYDAELAKALA